MQPNDEQTGSGEDLSMGSVNNNAEPSGSINPIQDDNTGAPQFNRPVLPEQSGISSYTQPQADSLQPIVREDASGLYQTVQPIHAPGQRFEPEQAAQDSGSAESPGGVGTEPQAQQPFQPMQQPEAPLPTYSAGFMNQPPQQTQSQPVQTFGEASQQQNAAYAQPQQKAPYQPNGGVTDGGGGSSVPPSAGFQGQSSRTNSSKKKALVTSLASALVLLLGSAGYVFGYYLPNTPERVWSTGLDRTGNQLTAIVEAFEDPASLETIDKSVLTFDGTVKGQSDGDDINVSVGVDSKYDEMTSQTNAEVGVEYSGEEINLSAEVRSSLPEGAVIPNIYFKLSGLSSLGYDSYFPGLSDLDGTWISIEQDYIEEQFADQIEEIEGSNQDGRDGLDDVTREDIVSIVGDVNEVTQEYVFTSNEEKSVIVLGSFVATEESEGIQANHYKAKIDVEHSLQYCEAIIDKLSQNDSMKKFFTDDEKFKEAMEDAKKDCRDNPPEIDPEETFDIWIDKKYKLFHKIRVYEDLEEKAQEIEADRAECIDGYQRYDFYEDDEINEFCDYYDSRIERGEKYTELGQLYKGNDQFVMFSNYYAKTNKNDMSGRAEFAVDARELSIAGSLTFKYKNPESEQDWFDVELTVKSEPFSGEIDSSKPEDAISIQEVLEMMQQASQSYYDEYYDTLEDDPSIAI